MSLSEEQLRERLFEAAARGGDDSTLTELCQRYREEIVAAWPGWQTMPEGVRSDPFEELKYGQALRGLAVFFARQLGDARLLEAPDRSQQLGLLGEACFMEGQIGAARDATLEALELSRQAGETEGVAAWLGNLYEIDRYRGDGPAASRWAAEFADLCDALDQPQAARRWRRLASVVQAEPIVRLVADVQGEEYELDELPPGAMRLLFRRNRLTLRPAQRLVDQGDTLADEGRHADALDRYRQACAADRHDPDPRARAGLALLHLGRYEEAVEAYAEAQRLGPGWYELSSEAWLAAELAAGRLAPEVWMLLKRAERAAPDEVLRLTEGAHPVLSLARGGALEQLGQTEAARESYRAAAEHAGEDNLKTRALLGQALLSPEPERTRLLQAAAILDGHLLAGAKARLLLGGGLTS